MPDTELPSEWRIPENIALKNRGDKILIAKKYIGLKVRSAVLPNEYNFILNPVFPGYYDLVKVESVEDYNVDKRLS